MERRDDEQKAHVARSLRRSEVIDHRMRTPKYTLMG
jgi:hypothetical protein